MIWRGLDGREIREMLFALGLLVVVVLIVVVVTAKHGDAAQHHGGYRVLDKVCRSGFEISDFSGVTDANLDPIPGLLRVECSSKRVDRYGLPSSKYTVVVHS